MEYPRTRLILVRHGETEANIAGRMQGRGDDPLTERGRRQVRAVAERIKREAHPVTAIYTSPLRRARSTAQEIGEALGLHPKVRDGLQEMNLGALEGVSTAELAAATPRSVDEPYPNGESARDFVERIMGALYGIVASNPGATVVAVSHGGVIATALSYWSHGHGGAWREYAPQNCAISIIEFSSGPGIVSFNDCAHL